MPQHIEGTGREFAGLEHAGPERVVDVVIDVGDAVGEPDDLGLEGGGLGHGPRVVHDAVAHLPGEVEARAVVLEVFDDAQALLVVAERPAQERRERLLAQVTERGVPQVVAQGDGFGEVLVEPQGSGRGPGDVRDVERVGEAHPVVVALGGHEHLGLVLEPPERLGVDDAVAVTLEDRADVVLGLVAIAALGGVGEDGPRRQDLVLDLLGPLSGRDTGGAHAPIVAVRNDRPEPAFARTP